MRQFKLPKRYQCRRPALRDLRSICDPTVDLVGWLSEVGRSVWDQKSSSSLSLFRSSILPRPRKNICTTPVQPFLTQFSATILYAPDRTLYLNKGTFICFAVQWQYERNIGTWTAGSGLQACVGRETRVFAKHGRGDERVIYLGDYRGHSLEGVFQPTSKLPRNIVSHLLCTYQVPALDLRSLAAVRAR